jgi:hypothetical protein
MKQNQTQKNEIKIENKIKTDCGEAKQLMKR